VLRKTFGKTNLEEKEEPKRESQQTEKKRRK